MTRVEIPEPITFEWDAWNIQKNLLKHKVTTDEMEQIFVDPGKRIFSDMFHSHKEDRYIIIGKTENGKILYCAFTLRNKQVRIISARNLNRKERYLFL